MVMAKRNNIPLKQIAKLNPNLINWKIKARLSFSNEEVKVKPISTGKICRVTLEDESGKIAGISYDWLAECVALNIAHNGKYYVTGADIRKAHPTNKLGHKYELHFIQNRTEFEDVSSGRLFHLDDEAVNNCKEKVGKSRTSSTTCGHGGVNLKPSPLAEVLASQNLLDSKKFDILAILKKKEKAEPMYSDKNTQNGKRTKFYTKKVTIIDETGEVILRLASEMMKKYEEHTWLNNPVVAVKDCVWKKYGNTVILTACLKDMIKEEELKMPAIKSRIKELKSWHFGQKKKASKGLVSKGAFSKPDEEKKVTESLGSESENLYLRDATEMKRKINSDVPESSAKFQKKNDNSLHGKELESIYAQGWHQSVGYLVCGEKTGTAFRIGHHCLMTAFHVIRDTLEMYINQIIEKAQSDPNRRSSYSRLLEKLNVEESGIDIEMKIKNGISEWLKKCYGHVKKCCGHVKITSLLSAMEDTGFLYAREQAMNFIRGNLMHVYFGRMTEHDDCKKYPLRIDIPFYSTEEADDVAVLEVDWTDLPDAFILDKSGIRPENVYIIGYPSLHGSEQRLDSNCPLISDHDALETCDRAVKWWEKNYPEKDPKKIREAYEGAFNKKKVLFHCSKSTTHGASGSPGLIDLDKGTPKVFLMLKEGFPGFAHSGNMKEKLKSCPKEYLLESGISMSTIYELLSEIPHLKELRDDIFHT